MPIPTQGVEGRVQKLGAAVQHSSSEGCNGGMGRYHAMSTFTHSVCAPAPTAAPSVACRRSLQEFKLLCDAAHKPQALLALLDELQGQSTVVFTSSLDTTHK